jgi:crotonobetainyl-CoA:carnitine CoA-transferase CaiB-like acyl-CoA transferase
MIVDEQVVWNKMIQEIEHPLIGPLHIIGPSIEFSRTPRTVRLPPPLLGEHSTVILSELGFSQEEVKGFLDSGAVTGLKNE